MNGPDSPDASIGDVRRLRLRTVAVRGMDDLVRPAAYFVPEPVATMAVRHLRRRGLTMLLVGLLFFAGFVLGATLLGARTDEVLATGEPTPGVVVGTQPGLRGTAGSIDVRFAIEDVARVRSMNLDDNSPALRVGDRITVFYDRQDHERIAAPGISNDPLLSGLLAMTAFALSVTLVLPGLIGFIRWNRRVRSMRRYGWRQGQVEADGNRIHRLRFSGNEPGTGATDEPLSQTMTVATTYPVAHQIPPEFRTGAVLVGGRGQDLTLVFARGTVLAAARQYRPLRA